MAGSGKGLTIVAHYQEVGRGWSKKRPEFQRMLADAKQGWFDTIVCWKSDRLSRGMYPAAALMEVVEAHQISLEAVMDAIDMKTFGLMAAIGKIELDNFRERASMGKRGTAKQGRAPTGVLPYGYRIAADGRPEIHEAEAGVARRIFRQYVHEGDGRGVHHLAVARRGSPGGQERRTVIRQDRQVATEDGTRVYAQPQETWIEIPVPTAGGRRDAGPGAGPQEAAAGPVQAVFYLLQHLLRVRRVRDAVGRSDEQPRRELAPPLVRVRVGRPKGSAGATTLELVNAHRSSMLTLFTLRCHPSLSSRAALPSPGTKTERILTDEAARAGGRSLRC